RRNRRDDDRHRTEFGDIGLRIGSVMRDASFVKRIYFVLGALFAFQCSSGAFAAEPVDAPPACADDPLYRQQDFILGTWDVFSGTKPVAQVRMERQLGGCAIREIWTEAGGAPGSGLGLFTYSRLLKAWQYLWAADTGKASIFSGSQTSPGAMRYIATHPLPDGGSRTRDWKILLLPDGRVRELCVGSNDQGRTWATEYDLTWVRAGT
ncbi:MAG TPA: hypothetical protein VNT42_11260, partial [Sphingomonas sp.]|nr:hypothetical protein [Sphingomonas sp.]